MHLTGHFSLENGAVSTNFTEQRLSSEQHVALNQSGSKFSLVVMIYSFKNTADRKYNSKFH